MLFKRPALRIFSTLFYLAPMLDSVLLLTSTRHEGWRSTGELPMKKYSMAIVLAFSMCASPAAIYTSTSATASTCGVDVPEGWTRPGGYCDQIGSTNSLVDTDGGRPDVKVEEEECWTFTYLLDGLEIGERVHVAKALIPCDEV